MRASEKDLQEIVGAIRSVADPAAIVLFGSQARGQANEHSDIDLLVIRREEFLEGESRRLELGRFYRAVAVRSIIPKDILLFTKSEVREWRNTTNHPVSEALRDGRVLYGEV
jgi:predicted nucleotidyltransferase